MLKRLTIALIAAALLAGPATGGTVTGSVTPNSEKLYEFIPPPLGGQALVSASWKQKRSTAVMLLGCSGEIGDDFFTDIVVFGFSVNRNADRTARIEAGVAGNACFVILGGLDGKVTFRLNVQVTEGADLMKPQVGTSGRSSRSGELAQLDPRDFPDLVRVLDKVRAYGSYDGRQARVGYRGKDQ